MPTKLRAIVRPLLVGSICAIRLAAAESTILEISGKQFTLNGAPTFLLGVSYYGGLGAPEEFVLRDLDDMQQHGFNWLRVWATWEGFGEDVSAVDGEGRPRQPYLDRLERLVAECDRRGLVVDVTLTRGAAAGRVPDLASHRRAVESVTSALKEHRNWYLDLANERDVHDDRYVATEEVEELCALAKRIDPERLVSASFGGHDLEEDDIRDALVTAKLDFLCPHRARHAESPTETETETRRCLQRMEELGRVAPLHYQEPFRRGYAGWEPSAADFLADLRGAVAGGAAGWCFHNGSQREADDERPRRSFDLRSERLFDQLDAQELKVVSEAEATVRATAKE